MSDIKTKDMIKDIKIINKSTYLKNMKNAFVKTKEKAEEINTHDSHTPHAYATESISAKAKDISSATVHKMERFGRQSLKETPDTLTKAKTGAANIKQRMHNTSKIIKTKRSAKAATNSSKSAGKVATNTVKTSKQAAHVSVKTAQATMKASQKAAQTAKAVAKATAQTAKVTAKAVVAAIKTTVAAVKGLITLIAAGGWVAVVIILVICMVAFWVSSPFGIFCSNDKTDPGNMTIASAIEQINNDFSARIEKIKSENSYDEVEGITAPQNWKDVLAIYAIKYSCDPYNPTEVATIDNNKFESIKAVFWAMNSISFSVETIESENSSGYQNTSSQATSKKILYIIVKNKSCSEMKAQYAFNSEQAKNLDELMKPKYNDMWNILLS